MLLLIKIKVIFYFNGRRNWKNDEGDIINYKYVFIFRKITNKRIQVFEKQIIINWLS